MKKKEGKLYFGKATRPHGIKGLAQTHLMNQQDSSLAPGVKLWLYPLPGSQLPEEGAEYEVSSFVIGHKVMLGLKTIADRTALEAILPFDIYRERQDLPELDEGEYYLTDLEGLDVSTTDGVVYGVIDSFYFNGAQDIVVLNLKEGGQMEVPFVEPFLEGIDFENGLVTLRPLEFRD